MQQPTSGQNVITINAGPNDVVTLRGLYIDGLNVAANGVSFNSGGELDIVNCVVRHFVSEGILIQPNSAASFSVTDTVASDNGGNSDGIYVGPSASVNGAIKRLTAVANAHVDVSIYAGNAPSGAKVLVSVADSVLSNSQEGAFSGSAPGTGIATLVLDNVLGSGNSNEGLWALTNGGGATTANIRLTQSVVSQNQIGALLQGGTISSLVNNTFSDNAGGDLSGGTLTTLAAR